VQLLSEDMDAENTTAIERVKAKLADLRRLDSAFTLFGASTHHYQLGRSLTVSELAVYERRLGLPFPAEYRDFVMEVGHGGAGPFYGLFPLDGSDPEDITDLGQVKKPFRWTEATNPKHWQGPNVEDGVWIDDNVSDDETPRVFLNVPGALYLCHYGCALRFFLVVNGLGLGEVWMDRQADDEGIAPEPGKDGTTVGFLQWYEKWLDDGISTLTEPKSE
jgi:hypothetical protein